MSRPKGATNRTANGKRQTANGPRPTACAPAANDLQLKRRSRDRAVSQMTVSCSCQKGSERTPVRPGRLPARSGPIKSEIDRQKRRGEAGFTLIDMIFTCALIGLLSSLALPGLTRAKDVAQAA